MVALSKPLFETCTLLTSGTYLLILTKRFFANWFLPTVWFDSVIMWRPFLLLFLNNQRSTVEAVSPSWSGSSSEGGPGNVCKSSPPTPWWSKTHPPKKPPSPSWSGSSSEGEPGNVCKSSPPTPWWSKTQPPKKKSHIKIAEEPKNRISSHGIFTVVWTSTKAKIKWQNKVKMLEYRYGIFESHDYLEAVRSQVPRCHTSLTTINQNKKVPVPTFKNFFSTVYFLQPWTPRVNIIFVTRFSTDQIK